jgi:metallo-beta-lactamase class B
MKSFYKKLGLIPLIGFYILFLSCHPSDKNTSISTQSKIQIDSIAPNVWIHQSYLNTKDFGRVSCNGLIFKDQEEVVVIDTPVDDSSSYELIQWIKNQLHAEIIAVIPTHFHEDCLGGLNAFHQREILSFANISTLDSAKTRNTNIPRVGFLQELQIQVGNEEVICSFVGAGHTSDNIVVYIPSQKVLFGGCLVKEIGANKGNLADADTKAWPISIQNLKEKFPEAKIIVPGHGVFGDRTLLDYTEKLFLK